MKELSVKFLSKTQGAKSRTWDHLAGQSTQQANRGKLDRGPLLDRGILGLMKAFSAFSSSIDACTGMPALRFRAFDSSVGLLNSVVANLVIVKSMASLSPKGFDFSQKALVTRRELLFRGAKSDENSLF